MVDTNKRIALKFLGGAAVISSVQSVALATGIPPLAIDSDKSINSPGKTDSALNTSPELTIEISIDPTPVVRLTNNSEEQIVVRHLHPGIVNAGARAFDLNSIFSEAACTIEAESSRDFEIKPVPNTQAETPFPRHLYRNQPQRVVAVKGHDLHGLIVNSSRSFYA